MCFEYSDIFTCNNPFYYSYPYGEAFGEENSVENTAGSLFKPEYLAPNTMKHRVPLLVVLRFSDRDYYNVPPVTPVVSYLMLLIVFSQYIFLATRVYSHARSFCSQTFLGGKPRQIKL